MTLPTSSKQDFFEDFEPFSGDFRGFSGWVEKTF